MQDTESTSFHSEAIFNQLIMHSPVAMCLLLGEDLIIDMANTAVLALWGRKWDEVKDKKLYEVFPELEGQYLTEKIKQVFKTGETFIADELPVTIVRKSNVLEMLVNFNFQALKNTSNEIAGVIAVGIDVTEQVTARKAIIESENKYRALFHSMNQGFGILEVLFDEANVPYDHIFVEINPKFEELTGFYGCQGKRASEVIPDLEKIWFSIYGKVATTGESIIFVEDSLVMNKSYEVHAFKLGDAQSHRIAVLFTEISDRRKEEAAQKKFADELSIQVQKQTKELQRSNEDLQQFAHVASHDLKEPVRKINFFIDMLQTDFGDILPDRANELISKTLRASNRLKDMINGILNFSLTDQSQHRIEEVDLNEIIHNIVIDLEVLIQNKNAEIDVTGELPTIHGSKVLINQVFFNLISNSLKFARPSVPVKVTISSKFINHNHVECAEIIIQDNGIGFEQAYADKIFENFSRLHSKDVYEGTGLGLALTRKIVQRHAGSIYATGKVNDGSTFYVILPLQLHKNYV